MKRLLLALLLSTSAAAHAQSLSKALVVPTCVTPRELEPLLPGLQQLTQDTQGRLCVAPGNAGGSKLVSPLMFYSNASPGATVTYWANLWGGTWGGSLLVRQAPMPIQGFISNLYVLAGNTVVSTNYYTFYLVVNGVLTPLRCSIGQGGDNLGTVTQCSDLNDSVAVNPGDLVALQISVPGGTATTLGAGTVFSMILTSENGQESVVEGGTNGYISSVAIQYIGLSQFTPNASEALVSAIMPTGGTLDHLYVRLSSAVNGARFTVFKNGVATGITTTCLTPAVLCTDLTDAITIQPKDTISLQTCPSTVAGCPGTGINPTAISAQFTMRFIPSVANQSMVFNVPIQFSAPNTSTKLCPMNACINFNGPAPLNYQSLVPVAMTFGDLVVAQCPGPDLTGAGTVTANYITRLGVVNQPLSAPILGNSTALCPTLQIAEDHTDTFEAPADSFVNLFSNYSSATNAATPLEQKTGMTVTVP